MSTLTKVSKPCIYDINNITIISIDTNFGTHSKLFKVPTKKFAGIMAFFF